MSGFVQTIENVCETVYAGWVRFSLWFEERPYLYSMVFATALSIVFMLFLDKHIALYFKESLSPNWRGFYKIMTELGEGGIWFALPVLVMGLCWGSKYSKKLQSLAFDWDYLFIRWRFYLYTMIVTAITNTVIKVVLGRFRPRYFFEDGLYGFQMFNTNFGMNSFPSGHTQTIFCAMVALGVLFPHQRIFFFVIAVIVAFSRVTTTVHYASDVLFSAVLTTVIVLFMRDRFEEKHGLVRIG